MRRRQQRAEAQSDVGWALADERLPLLPSRAMQKHAALCLCRQISRRGLSEQAGQARSPKSRRDARAARPSGAAARRVPWLSLTARPRARA